MTPQRNHTSERISLDGKFFRNGQGRFHPKGVAYGPFAPNARNEMFPELPRADQDFGLIRELGANLIRVYHPPPSWLLDLAAQHGLRVLVDVPWPAHLCFLDSRGYQEQARAAVRQAAARCGGHPAVFALSVANEIPADIVRWSGTRKVEKFLEELIDVAKSLDPNVLCTFANFPPTEFLNADSADFVSFNVYLHELMPFEDYLARLQMISDTKPLVISEFGMDSIREGEPRKSAFLPQQIEAGFRLGLAGVVLFSFTDDWFRGGVQIEDWAFGLTTRQRSRKASFHAVQKAFQAAPYFQLDRSPKVSVVVASYNGAATLRECLDSLSQLNYPNYEVILVDDGSTDGTPEISKNFPNVQTIRQKNMGLAVARNTGIAAAGGEIVAFTDSDCRADQDWLYYLVGDLVRSTFGGMGGHNLLPPDDSAVAAAVMASPGGPAHVMLTDREAEHVPGCNMAFYRSLLNGIGGFDPVYHAAGDDVDVCWRLQQYGYRIGFSPAGFVWHYRRSTIRAYLKQQAGYGEAEGLLVRKHPTYFNSVGRSMWRGRIYTSSRVGVVLERPIIYRGTFGTGFFQRLYTPEPSQALMLTTSLEYHMLVNIPLLALSALHPDLWPLALTSILASLGMCVAAAAQADLPRQDLRFWSRPLVALLFFLQPICRGLARHLTRLHSRPASAALARQVQAARVRLIEDPHEVFCYWSGGDVDRCMLLSALLDRLGRERWQVKSDLGWADHDMEISAGAFCRLRMTTVTEQLEQKRTRLRCRLESLWSLPATIAFWVLFGVELIVAARLAPQSPWIWMILISLPVMVTLLDYEQSQHRKVLAATIDEVAGQLKLTRLPARET